MHYSGGGFTLDRFCDPEKIIWTLQNGLLTIFGICWGHFDAKKSYFDVFSRCFDGFARSQLFGSVAGVCTGAQKPRKIEFTKNELKHPQSSVGWHIKGFKVRLSGLGYPMSQSTFVPQGRYFKTFCPNGNAYPGAKKAPMRPCLPTRRYEGLPKAPNET